MRKTLNVVCLPTEKATFYPLGTIVKSQVKEIGLALSQRDSAFTNSDIPQHLYFTAPSIEENGEEIKEGDWFYSKSLNQILQATGHLWIFKDRNAKFREKVIATTNPELWKKSLPQHHDFDRIVDDVPKIPLDFVERYVKEQGKIDKVDVEYDRHIENGIVFLQEPKLNNSGQVKVFPVEESWDDIWLKWRDSWDVHHMNYERYLQEHYSPPKKL